MIQKHHILETRSRRVDMSNLERRAAVSNATSHSLVTAVCLQVTDPVFHLRHYLVLLQPKMPLDHLPATTISMLVSKQ